MEPVAEQHEEAPGEKIATDKEDPEGRIREPLSFAMSVAGTVAAFVAGFGILPSSTAAEKLLILCTVIGVSGAIIFGIGARRSGRRFLAMSVSAGLAFVCLAALSVVAQSASPAPGNASGPAVTGPSGASAAAGGYKLLYRDATFTMPGDSCQSDESTTVQFTEQRPDVTPFVEYGLDDSNTDMLLNCLTTIDIEFPDASAHVSGSPDASACYDAVSSNPFTGGITFPQLNTGMQVCLLSTSDDELILVTLLSASGSSYTTTWTATAWSVPASS